MNKSNSSSSGISIIIVIIIFLIFSASLLNYLIVKWFIESLLNGQRHIESKIYNWFMYNIKIYIKKHFAEDAAESPTTEISLSEIFHSD